MSWMIQVLCISSFLKCNLHSLIILGTGETLPQLCQTLCHKDTSTHWSLVTPYGIMDVGHHWFRYNALSCFQCQAITWISIDSLSVGTFGTSINEIWITILQFSFKRVHLKTSSASGLTMLKWSAANCSKSEETAKKTVTLSKMQRIYENALWQQGLSSKIIQESYKKNEFITFPEHSPSGGLTHWGRVTPKCVSRIYHHWFR